MSVAIVGDGTLESTWSPWLGSRTWPLLDLASVAGRRVVVLASHPDDEVLGVGGLMHALALRRHEIVIAWATDGEASHPASTVMSRPELARIRREESQQALAQLGVTPVATHHLGLPDSQLTSCADALRDAVVTIICPGDVVLAPWSSDGHPDHDALGEVAADLVGVTTWHYPIWAWHWAWPNDERVPWDRFRGVAVPHPAAKAGAIDCFRSQIDPLGAAAADAVILPPQILARFRRDTEWVIT